MKKQPARRRKPKLRSVTLGGVWDTRDQRWTIDAGVFRFRSIAIVLAGEATLLGRPAVARRLCTTKEKA